MFANSAFISSGGASAIFGAYFGIMLDSMYLKGTPSTINDTLFLKSCLRIVVTLLVVSPLLSPMMLIGKYSPMMILYIFKMTMPSFLAMLVLFSVVKLVHIKMKLVNYTGLGKF